MTRHTSAFLLAFILIFCAISPPVAAAGDIAGARRQLEAAMAGNDAAALAALYRDDAISNAPYQPTLLGREQIEAYRTAMAARRPVAGFSMTARDVFDFGGTVVETGAFEVKWAENGDAKNGDEGATEPGSYMLVWKRDGNGADDSDLAIMADAWGFHRALPDQQDFFVAEISPYDLQRPLPENDLSRRLAAQNARMAGAVQDHDAETRIAFFTQDAVFMPYADTPKAGIEVLTPYITAYTEQGRGATFEAVDVWTIGFEDLGTHVLEYSKFRVVWRAGQDGGTVSGGGIRLWQRREDGTLLMHREIGTHDYRP